MRYIDDFKTFEGINGSNDYTVGDVVLVRFEITNGDAVLTPVKIIKRFTPNSFIVTHKTEGSQLVNFPDFKIKHRNIISLYRALDQPMDSDHMTQNPKFNVDGSSSVPGANGKPTNDITKLPANQSLSNDISI